MKSHGTASAKIGVHNRKFERKREKYYKYSRKLKAYVNRKKRKINTFSTFSQCTYFQE